MQNPIPDFLKGLSFLRNQVFCMKNWKLWRAPTTTEFNIFLKFCTRFLLNNVYKSVFGIFFFFVLILSWVCRNQVFFNFFKKFKNKKKKKNPEHAFVVLGARKIFKFFRNKPGFSKTIEVCLNFYMWFSINLYKITKKSLHKN